MLGEYRRDRRLTGPPPRQPRVDRRGDTVWRIACGVDGGILRHFKISEPPAKIQQFDGHVRNQLMLNSSREFPTIRADRESFAIVGIKSRGDMLLPEVLI